MLTAGHMITVNLLSAEQEAEYSELLLSNPSSLIYASLEFRDFLQDAVGGEASYLIAHQFGKIVGSLPLFRRTASGFGSVINSLPWYGSHGGIFVASEAPDHARGALLARYKSIANEPDILTATLIQSPLDETETEIYSEALANTVQDHRTGQITKLPIVSANIEADLEAILAQKTRNLVRKSRKQGFELRRDSGDAAWEFLYTVHQENMLAIGGKAKPREHFEALRRRLPEEWRQISIASLNNEPVAALLLLYYNKTVEYFTPVVRQQFRSMQPLSFLIWHGMLDAIEKGFAWWNWGGTWASQKTLHHFKAGWGATDYPYSYLIHASPRGMDALHSNKMAVANAFPYYYVFPFDQLSNND